MRQRIDEANCQRRNAGRHPRKTCDPHPTQAPSVKRASSVNEIARKNPYRDLFQRPVATQ
jgi:hypothetical protein